jgi:hypothetical protein
MFTKAIHRIINISKKYYKKTGFIRYKFSLLATKTESCRQFVFFSRENSLVVQTVALTSPIAKLITGHDLGPLLFIFHPPEHSIWSYWLLVAVMGWYRTKRLTHCGHFLIYYASISEL